MNGCDDASDTVSEKSLLNCDDANYDDAWLRNLVATHQGRVLSEHLASYDRVIRNSSNPEDAVQQCFSFRRVFVHAFSANKCCFGLPDPTPKCIAIVNLSGHKGLVYSDSYALIRLLCIVSPGAVENIVQGVNGVMCFAAERSLSLLLSFSLPWQAGVHGVHWELRTLRRDDDGDVYDGDCAYQPTFTAPRMVTSTMQSDSSDARVMDAQVKAFGHQFGAACLDIDAEVDAELSGINENGSATSETGMNTVNTSPAVAKLHSLLSVLQADRKTRTAELRQLEHSHATEIETLKRNHAERVDKLIRKCTVCRDTKDAELADMRQEMGKLKESDLNARVQAQELRQKHAEEVLNWHVKHDAMAAQLKISEAAAKTATEELKRTKASSSRESEKQEKALAAQLRTAEDLERSLSHEKLEVRKAMARIDEMKYQQTRLEQVIDSMRGVEEVNLIETRHQRRERVGLRCALAVACQKHAARVKAVEERCAGERRAKVQALAGKDAVNEELASLRTQIEETKPALAKPETKDAEISTEPMQDPPELIKLQIEYAKLLDLLEQHGITVQPPQQPQPFPPKPQPQLPAQEPQPQPQPQPVREPHPPQQLPVQEPRPPQQLPIQEPHPPPQPHPPQPMQSLQPLNSLMDGGSDACGDRLTENLIVQAATSVSALAELARSGCVHKANAETLWAEISAMRNHMMPAAMPRMLPGSVRRY